MLRSEQTSYDDLSYAVESKERETSGSLSPFTYLCAVLIISLLGLTVLYSSSYSAALDKGLPHYWYFIRQAAGGALGLAAGFMLHFAKPGTIRKIWYILLPLSIIALAASCIPGFGDSGFAVISGHKIVSAPSLGLFAMVMLISDIFPEGGRGERVRLLFSSASSGVILIFSLASGGFGWFFLSSLSLIVILRVKKVGRLPLLIALLFIIVTAVLAAVLFPSLISPVLSSFLPVDDPALYDQNLFASRDAIAAGGIAGAGLGKGLYKLGSLSSPESMFIFASMSEELGLIGSLALLLLLFFVAVIGVRTTARANRRNDSASAAVATGLTLFLVLRSLFNILYVSAFLPLPGILLPFFSYDPSGEFLSVLAAALLYRFIYMMGRENEKK